MLKVCVCIYIYISPKFFATNDSEPKHHNEYHEQIAD